MARVVEVREEGVTVDLVAWRLLGRTREATEEILRLNRGLADLGPTLPPGTRLIVPDPPAAPPRLPSVNLWD